MDIHSVQYLTEGRLTISQGVADDFCFWLPLPQINFLRARSGMVPSADSARRQIIVHPSWQGEHSGCLIGGLKTVLTSTLGEADLLITYADGSRTGLRVNNGQVTEMEVEVTLRPKSSVNV